MLNLSCMVIDSTNIIVCANMIMLIVKIALSIFSIFIDKSYRCNITIFTVKVASYFESTTIRRNEHVDKTSLHLHLLLFPKKAVFLYMQLSIYIHHVSIKKKLWYEMTLSYKRMMEWLAGWFPTVKSSLYFTVKTSQVATCHTWSTNKEKKIYDNASMDQSIELSGPISPHLENMSNST